MARRPLGRLATILAVGPVVLGGCTEDRDAGGRTPAAGSSVELRRVITSSPLTGGCRASADVCAAWADFACPGEPQPLHDDLLMACGADDEADQPYLLSAPEIIGGVASAEATGRDRIDQWEVEIELDASAADAFAELTADLAPGSAQLAIVLDGTVVAAPAVQTPVTDGVVRLAGDYTQAEAERLADRIGR